MSVDILMATCNGGKYLRNQLLSLQQQTYGDWTLWIRDDISTDDTMLIIRKFAESDSRIKIVGDSTGLQLGPGKNFLSLTKYSTADYVTFCDQDDLWFEKKLEILVDFAEKNFDINIPSLAYCDAYGYSDETGVITVNGISRNHAKKLSEFLFFNAGYQGCSMLFNRRLCTIAANYRANYYLHDDVISLLAHSFGRVFFVPKKLMLYRQHESNVTGNINHDFRVYFRRIFDKDLNVISRRHYLEIESFYNEYKDDLDNYDMQLFAAYLTFPKEKLIRRVLLIVCHGFSLGGSRLKLIVKTIIRRPINDFGDDCNL